MLRPKSNAQVFVYRDPVDMRKSINGLAAIVESELESSPMSGALFVFCNRARDKVKLLYWERNGFVLWYMRLEKHKFKWLTVNEEAVLVTGQHIDTLSSEVSRLSELVMFFKVRQFSKSIEKHPDQAELFNEPEVEEDSAQNNTNSESLNDLSKEEEKIKAKAGHKPLPETRVEHSLPAGEKCDCGSQFKEIGKEVC